MLLAALAFANFGARLAVVRPGRFQFADGIRLMDWRFAAESKAQPLYPMLATAVRTLAGDPILSAALVASFFGAVTLFPLFLLTKRLHGSRAAWWTSAIYSSLAAIYIQSAGVTANPLLVFCLLAAILAFVSVFDPARGASAAPVVFWAGTAALVRPEGILLWPLAAVALIAHVRHRRPIGVGIAFAILPFVGWLVWNYATGGTFLYGAELVLGADEATSSKFLEYLKAYLADFSSGLFHLYTLAALAGVGLSVVNRAGEPERRTLRAVWHAVLAYTAASVFAVLALHWAYVPRLLAPLQVLALVPAGCAFAAVTDWRSRWRYVLAIPPALLVALTAIGSAALVVNLARTLSDIGVDIRAAAEAAAPIAERVGAARITSDMPVETAYYSGRDVEWYMTADARAGDLVVLHNIRTPLTDELAELETTLAVRCELAITAPYVPPSQGGLPIATGEIRLDDLTARQAPEVDEPYRSVVWYLTDRPTDAPADPD